MMEIKIILLLSIKKTKKPWFYLDKIGKLIYL